MAFKDDVKSMEDAEWGTIQNREKWTHKEKMNN